MYWLFSSLVLTSSWTISRKRFQGEALFIVVSMQQPLVCTGLEEAMSRRSCSITWHSFSPWHNLSKLSSVHGLPKELLLVVKVVQVVFYVSTSNYSIFPKNLIYCTCCPKRCFPHVPSVAFPHAPKRFSSKISLHTIFFREKWQ